MNPVLREVYGTGGLAKTSSVGSEGAALRRAYLHLRDHGGLPADHADVQRLGGPEAAREKISEAMYMLHAWDEGEEFGQTLAEEILIRTFDGAHELKR